MTSLPKEEESKGEEKQDGLEQYACDVFTNAN